MQINGELVILYFYPLLIICMAKLLNLIFLFYGQIILVQSLVIEEILIID